MAVLVFVQGKNALILKEGEGYVKLKENPEKLKRLLLLRLLSRTENEKTLIIIKHNFYV